MAGQGTDPEHPERGLALFPLSDAIHDNPWQFYAGAGITLGLTGLVLLIACCNLTNLLIARISSRSSEIAIRLALGANRLHIIRLVVIETGFVMGMAAILGLALAYGAVRWLGTSPLLSEGGGLLPQIDASLDWRVMSFTLVAAVTAALGIIGTVTARLSGMHALGLLSARGGSGGYTPLESSARAKLAAVQVASTVVLLVAAGLLVKSFLLGAGRDPGFRADGAVIGRLDYRLQGYSEDRARELARAVVEAVAAAPGVSHAALASGIPGLNDPVESVVVQAERSETTDAVVSVLQVSPDFFTTIGLPIHMGRSFTAEDIAGSDAVVVLSRSVAERFWPGSTPIGRYIRFVRDRLASQPPSRVIGVVGDPPGISSRSSSRRIVFAPLEQRFPRRLAVTIIARGEAPRDQLLRAVRDGVASADPDSLVYDLQTLRARVERVLGGVRMMAEVLSVIAVLGLVIAFVGVYGVIAYLVSRRRRELCIRKALGSTDLALCRLVAAEGLRMLLAGVLPAIVLAVAVGFGLQSFLIGVSPYDWRTIGGVAVAVVGTGLVACVIPTLEAIGGDTARLLKEF